MNDEAKEISYNVVNSLLAGSLVFLGALTGGSITGNSLMTACIAALVVFVTKFKDYWDKETKKLTRRKTDKINGLFAFIG